MIEAITWRALIDTSAAAIAGFRAKIAATRGHRMRDVSGKIALLPGAAAESAESLSVNLSPKAVTSVCAIFPHGPCRCRAAL